MGQTLTTGVYLPDEGERNCYTGLAGNWQALDNHLGNANIHVTYEDKQAWNNHIADTVKHVTAEDKATWNGKADASALTAHTGDTTIHVTAADKQTWNGKADASALTAHTGDTTIHVTAEDKAAWNGKAEASALTAHTGDTTIHVTAEDKAKWDAVTGKANDANVVHKSGNETIGGQKTFSHGQTGVGRDIFHLTPIPYGKNTPPATTSYQYIWFTGNSASQGLTNNWYGGYLEQLVGTDGSARGRWLVRRTDETAASVEILASADNTLTFRPTNGNVMQLGDSSRPWKDCKTSAINGLNPSSLSMPDLSNGIDISSYIARGTGHNEYTPPANGYVSIILKNTSATAIFLYQGDFGKSSYSSTSLPNETDVCCINSIPVISGTKVNIDIKGANAYIVSAKFYPCQGNV